MKITKRQLRRVIKEELLSEVTPGEREEAIRLARADTKQPNVPDIMDAIGGGKFQPRLEGGYDEGDLEDYYVQAVRILGTRSVVRAIIEQLSKKGVSDEDHREILRVLDHESY
jgi:hypothetical protein